MVLSPAPSTIVVAIDEIADAAPDVVALCARVRRLVEASGAEVVVYDVGRVLRPDVATIDALARLALTARRLGREVRLRYACPELRELLDLTGLLRILPCCPDGVGGGDGMAAPASALGVEGQAEQREQGGGVEEGVEADDPSP